MVNNRKNFTLRLTETLKEEVIKESKKLGISQNDYINMAVAKYLDTTKQKQV